MGDARRNPNSPQYIDPSPPRYRVGVMFDAMAVPTKKWLAENPPKEGDPKQALCPEDELEVALIAYALYAEPSSLVPQGQWPQGMALLGELDEKYRVPFREWQKKVKDANPSVPWRTEGPRLEALDS